MWFGQKILHFDFEYVATGTIEPECTRGGHYHKRITEKILCVHGTLLCTLDDEITTLHSGDMIQINANIVHTIKNIGDTTAFFVEIKDQEITNEDKDTYWRDEK